VLGEDIFASSSDTSQPKDDWTTLVSAARTGKSAQTAPTVSPAVAKKLAAAQKRLAVAQGGLKALREQQIAEMLRTAVMPAATPTVTPPADGASTVVENPHTESVVAGMTNKELDELLGAGVFSDLPGSSAPGVSYGLSWVPDPLGLFDNSVDIYAQSYKNKPKAVAPGKATTSAEDVSRLTAAQAKLKDVQKQLLQAKAYKSHYSPYVATPYAAAPIAPSQSLASLFAAQAPDSAPADSGLSDSTVSGEDLERFEAEIFGATVPEAGGGPFITIHVKDIPAVVKGKAGAIGGLMAGLVPTTITAKVYSEMASQLKKKFKEQENIDIDVAVVTTMPFGGPFKRDFLVGAGVGAGMVGVSYGLFRIVKHFFFKGK
jgi:hypothetical protein